MPLCTPRDEMLDHLRTTQATATRLFVASQLADLRRQQITAPLQSLRDSAATRARLLVAEGIERKTDA